jgi:2-polyprenyl-3-methyl-5-hydroxy-6-metoxy-1,4-benzoquinol methylase
MSAERDRSTDEHFERLASRWSERYQAGGDLAGRIDRLMALVGPRLTQAGRVLDFGCGAGHLAEALAASGQRVSAVDAAAGMLEQARRRVRTAAVSWAQVSARPGASLPFARCVFDAAIASSVLEYVAAPRHTLEELARVVRPGGWVLASVPDPRHPLRRREAWKRRVACLGPVRWLLRRTAWRDAVSYLHASRNRWPLTVWAELLVTVGLEPEELPDPDQPLAAIVARKV